MRTPADDDAPLYVPAEFEAEHLDDARRTVIRSALVRKRGRTGTRRSRLERWRAGAVFAHLIAGAIAVVIAAVTGTWGIGVSVLAVLALSLGVSLTVFGRIAQSLSIRRRRDTS